MVDDNAINLETGETIYVGMFEKLPPNHYWLIDMEEKNWLELVRRLTKRTANLPKLCANCHANHGDSTCEEYQLMIAASG